MAIDLHGLLFSLGLSRALLDQQALVVFERCENARAPLNTVNAWQVGDDSRGLEDTGMFHVSPPIGRQEAACLGNLRRRVVIAPFSDIVLG